MVPAWFGWTLVTLLAWGVWAVLSKTLDDHLSALDTQVLSTVGFLPILFALRSAWSASQVEASESSSGDRAISSASASRARRLGILLALAAGGFSALGNLPYYGLLQSGAKAATAVSMTAMAPLFTVLLAVTLLRERLNRIQCFGLVCSLVAIGLLNVNTVSGLWTPWLLMALLPMVLWGTAGFLQKLATTRLSGEAAAFWFLLAFPLFSLATFVYDGPRWPTSLTAWLIVSALGFCLALGNYTVLVAYAAGGKASVIAPLTSLYPLISVPLAIALLNEHVTRQEWRGIAVAAVAVTAIAFESQPENKIDLSVEQRQP